MRLFLLVVLLLVVVARAEDQPLVAEIPTPSADSGVAHMNLTADSGLFEAPVDGDGLRGPASSFLLDNREHLVAVPLVVNLALVGLDADGAYQFRLSNADFMYNLVESFREHTPTCLETGERLGMYYTVVFEDHSLPTRSLREIEDHLRDAMKPALATPAPSNERIPTFDINIPDVEDIFDAIYTTNFVRSSEDTEHAPSTTSSAYTIFLINPDKRRMVPHGFSVTMPEAAHDQPRFNYRYTFMGGGHSQVFLGRKRYVVIDLSAGPSQYGALTAGEGTVCYLTIPRIERVASTVREIAAEHQRHSESLPPTTPPPPPADVAEGEEAAAAAEPLPVLATLREVELHSGLSSLVISAVRHLFAPDTRFDVIDFSEKLVVPLVVLRNHHLFDPLASGHRFSIDLKHIESELKAMLLPNQQLTFISGLHNMHDHRQISLALAKSIRSDTVHEASTAGTYGASIKQYIDSEVLLEELSMASDALSSGVLGAAHAYTKAMPHVLEAHETAQRESFLAPSLQRQRDKESAKKSSSHGARVLPVFVFSLVGFAPELLIDQKSLVAVSHDAVVVLQTNTPSIQLPFFTDAGPVFTHPTSPTRHILAGLASAIGGIAAPYEQYDHFHKRVVVDYLWATGHQPMGPFSNANTLSAVHLDHIVRNAVISRVSAAWRCVRSSVVAMEAFVAEYMYSPFGEPIEHVLKLQHTGLIDYWFHAAAHGEIDESQLAIPVAVVSRLHQDLEQLEALFTRVSTLLRFLRLAEANTESSSLLVAAQAFSAYMELKLKEARDDMACCRLAHHHKEGPQYLWYLGVFSLIFILAKMGWDWANTLQSRSSSRPTQRRFDNPSWRM